VIQTDLIYQPAYTTARVTFDEGDAIRAESGAMVSMSGQIEIETKAQGGIFKSLGRSMLGGESFFMNTFHARGDDQEILLAPSLPGDIALLPLAGTEMIVQSGSFLASDVSINVETKWGGARSFFGGEGLFMLKCSGTGDLLVASYGAIHKRLLTAGETYTVDSGHIVAFDAHIPYQPRKAGSWKSTIFGGEGFVVDFQGPGETYLQTRSQQSLLSWLIPRLPNKSN
jgi:uncharacterized protein (TIGR00266 family)